MVCSPVEKYNSIDLIPASQDRDGYRDTIKGLNYYDAIVTEKARPAIYVSYDLSAPTVKKVTPTADGAVIEAE